MATQSQSLDLDNSAQLEPSLTYEVQTQILNVSYEAPIFKDVQEFRTAFDLAEQGAHEAARNMFRNLAELIRYCAMMRSYLSERGVNADLRKAAGIPAGFERWYTDFRAKYDIAWAYKTMLHKIAELEGGCEHCGRLAENDADHKKSCILYRPLIELAKPEEGSGGGGTRIDMREATNAYYADRYLAMVGLLTNAPKDTSPQQIIETMRAESEAAYEDLDAEMAKKLKVPKLVKLKDADYTGLKNGNAALKAINDSLKERLGNLEAIPENLRDESITASLNAEPDSGIASTLLTAYLHSIVDRILPPSMTSRKVSAEIEIAGRDKRIMIGDFLRKQNRSKKDAPIQLAKCTGIGQCENRRRVREWIDGKWDKEHVVYNGDEPEYTVITEQAARDLAPEAFAAKPSTTVKL
jgi:hypothetical protein